MNSSPIRSIRAFGRRCRPHRVAFIAALAATVGSKAIAQETPVDRWLVSGASVSAGENPLLTDGGIAFPERNLDVGPGEWTLVREDGRTEFDFTDRADGDRAVLAHTYIRAPHDGDVDITITTASCAGLMAWANGQPLLEASGTRQVRLAGGWNTLLALVDGDGACPRTLAARIAGATGPQDDDASEGMRGLRVQASRPPGMRPNYPEGVVTLEAPTVSRLTWSTGRDDLDAAFDIDVTSWGRGDGGGGGVDDREAPPDVDLTGEWEITLYGPMGIQRMLAELEMSPDGELEGRLRRGRSDERERQGREFEGDIRDGWVSGIAFGWKVRAGGRGRSAELEFTGEADDGHLEGIIDFGGARDFDSRFEGRRAGEEVDVEGDEEPSETRRPDPRAGDPRAAAPADQLGVDPETANEGRRYGPTDPDGRRQRMVAFLLGDQPVKPSAPRIATLELDIGGERVETSAEGLAAGVPHRVTHSVPFKRARDAALRADGFRAKVRWTDEDRELEGGVDPAELLEALHGPVRLGGLNEGAGGESFGTFRIPEAWDGFTLRGSEGDWWVNEVPVEGGVLCDPCRRGQEIAIRVQDAESAFVRIMNRGYPDAAADGPPALEWLRALSGDNRKYRELAGG
ncbi:MAG: hypothetical protein MJB57_11630 [Gemmatimonadetes bacterium]|nr:hypothetical protein [Gemmatimonadota bacterium]